MYTFINASLLPRQAGSSWIESNIADTPLSDVFGANLQIYLTVFESFQDKNIFVDMNEYRTELANSPLTVAAWLVLMDGVTLKTVEAIPTSTMLAAPYANAILSGYNIQLARLGYPYPEEMPLTELHDLILTRPGFPTDLSLLHTHSLMSVNGYFHRSDADARGAYILDGGITAAMTRCSHTGIWSFVDLGGVTIHGLSDEDIIPLTPDSPLEDGIILTIPAPLEGKSLLFFLGGYLIQEQEGTFYRVGDQTWVLNIKGIPYLERYMESRHQIDLSSLDVASPDTSDGIGAVTADLYKDETIRAYLKLSQSFMALVGTPQLYSNKIFLRVSEIPGFVTAYQDPIYPLIMGYGKKVEFSKVEEAGYWALRIDDVWYRQYAFSTGYLPQQTVISDQTKPYQQYLRTQGYMLEMRGQKVPFGT